ncbi:MAG: phosphonate ABC transporter, permease protein PhnE, partial [Bdellovibrionales bacterium]|nr:phosphonate ABC transporter, permease protein PhnE [Bdellovibrionales bacterium]
LAFLLIITWWCAAAVEFSMGRLIEGSPYMADFLKRMWPPDLTILDRVFTDTLLTIQLAWVSTVIAVVLSLPVGFMAASNIFENRMLRAITIFFLNADRAIDSLILALFFVSAVGLGPFPGTLALAIHSVGMLGKLFADAIEAIDRGPVEALESAGANKLEMIRWAVWPQVAPHFISFFLFRFELNVRVAVVLGLVGAGGIGFLLTSYMRLFQYQKVATVILVILVLVMLVDYFSSKLRRSVL